MQLIQVKINGYKHLKETCVDFRDMPQNKIFRDARPVRFFIGLNGSGKSVFLEGICFLFSRIVQNEVPGFDFTLIYRIQRDAMYQVEVRNGTGKHKLCILVCKDGNENPEKLYSFEKHRYLLPDYVLTCASGENNSFYDIMMRSPKASLYSDLFDLSLMGQSRKNDRERREGIDKVLNSLRLLEENPICMFIDDKNSIFVLAAFLAILPGREGDGAVQEHIRCRREILSMPDSAPRPVTLSLTLDVKRCQELGDEIKQYGAIFDAAYIGEGEEISASSWNTTRLYQDEVVDTEYAHADKVITFLFEPYIDGEEQSFCVKNLTQAYESPVEFLSKLVLARNRGIIKEGHIGFSIRGTEDILEESALSEGEYMLLVRLGLLALGRYGEGNGQCLFLMDEPDVHLNEYWNIDFASKIYRMYENTKAMHEIVIATHSSLMLTDAFPDQLYYFQQRGGNVQCHNIKASTFGGSRNEIMEALFKTGHSVGNYSYAKVEKILDEVEDAEELEDYLKSIGSGYLRMRLLDKIQILKKNGE